MDRSVERLKNRVKSGPVSFEAIRLHEVSTLFLLDIAAGVPVEGLERRAGELQQAVADLRNALGDAVAENLPTTDSEVPMAACRKCLLQPGEKRNNQNSV